MEIRIILNILYRRRVILCLVLGTFLLLIGLITLSASKSYEATAKIIVEKTDKIAAIMNGLGLQGLVLDTQVDDDLSFDTDIELLMIKPLAERLIVEMDLRNSDGEYRKPNDFLNGGIKSKFKGEPYVTIEQYNFTALISITANAVNPEQASRIANRLAQMYKEERIERTKADFEEVKKNINKSLAKIREDYYQNLQAYKEFRQHTGVVSMDSTITNLLGQIVALENQQAEYQRNTATLAERIAVSRQQLETTNKLWEAGRELGQNSLVTELKQRLATLSAELASRGVTITKNHPEYKNLIAQADVITGLINNEPELSISKKQFVLNPVYEALYQTISDNIVSLKTILVGLETVDKQLKEYKERLLQLPSLQMDNSKLSMDLSVNSGIYSDLLKYSMKIKMAESVAVSKIRLVEPAKVPNSEKPNFPNKAVNLILGVIFGCFFAVGTALVVDYADNSVREVAILRDLSKKPCLGFLPYVPLLAMRPKMIFHSSAKITEPLRTIRDTLLFEIGEQSTNRIFLVTSATERGGASTVAAGLAKILADQHGKTLLVDLNLRAPSTFGLLKRSPTIVGVVEALRNNGIIDDTSLQDSPVEGLSILHGGTLLADPGTLLDSPALAILLNNLRQRFRYIVIDSPSLAFYHDAMVIAGEVDAVVLVVRAAEASNTAIAHCIDKMRIVGDRLVGTVLNNEGYSLALHQLPLKLAIVVPELLRKGIRKFKRC